MMLIIVCIVIGDIKRELDFRLIKKILNLNYVIKIVVI